MTERLYSACAWNLRDGFDDPSRVHGISERLTDIEDSILAYGERFDVGFFSEASRGLTEPPKD